jgi:pyridoxamine 5'-phosphate oxidase family protein
MFTQHEEAFIRNQHLVRIATVSTKGQPDVAPIGFEFDGQVFALGGYDLVHTTKYINIKEGNVQVALVFDDLESVHPWMPRGIKIHGTAMIAEDPHGGPILLVTPECYWSWGIESPAFVDGKPVLTHKACQTVEA